MADVIIRIGEDLTGVTTANSNYGYCAPCNTYYEDNRTQMILTASQLTQMGAEANDVLQEIGFYPTQASGRTMDNVRFYIAHTSLTALTAWIDYSGLTNVFGPTNVPIYSPLNQYHPHTLTTEFTWNGTSNLLFDFSRDNSAWTAGGEQRYTTNLSGNNIMRYQRTDGASFPYAPTSANSGTNLMDLYLKFERTEVVSKNRNLMIGSNF